jgi:hypothetical protein
VPQPLSVDRCWPASLRPEAAHHSYARWHAVYLVDVKWTSSRHVVAEYQAGYFSSVDIKLLVHNLYCGVVLQVEYMKRRRGCRGCGTNAVKQPSLEGRWPSPKNSMHSHGALQTGRLDPLLRHHDFRGVAPQEGGRSAGISCHDGAGRHYIHTQPPVATVMQCRLSRMAVCPEGQSPALRPISIANI